jgi:hypothetical protein
MSTTITPTEQNIEINVNNDVIDINVTNEIVDVNATTQQIDINVAGAYPIPNPVLSVFGRTGEVVATEGDYTLTQLGDVTLTSPSNGQVLKYNGTAWVNSTDADTGITTLNTLTALSQTFATGTSGTDFNISSATATHTFNLPTASATNRGALSSADWTTFNNKQNALTNPITGTGTSGQVAYFNGTTSLTSSATFAFTPTSQLLVNNSVTAASAIARGTNLTPTLTAAANNDVLVGLDINPTFTNGAFTGVSNLGLRVAPRILLNGTASIAPDFAINSLGASNSVSTATFQLNGVARFSIGYSQTNSVNRFFIYNNNGATSEPFAIFLNSSNVIINGGFAPVDAGFRLDVNGSTRTQGSMTIGSGGSYVAGSIYSDASWGMIFRAQQASPTTAQFRWANSADTELMRISTSNNLLINQTTDAGFRLDVNGTARVQGNMILNTMNLGIGTGSTTNQNMAFGFQAGSGANTGTGGNMFLGYQVGRVNTSGSYNVGLGYVTLFSNTTGIQNTAIGTDVLYFNTTGSNNTAIGTNAGTFISGGVSPATIVNNSIFIGYQAYPLASSQTNQIVIGYDVVGLGSNTTSIGNASTVTTAIYGDLLIGTTTALASTKFTLGGSETASGAIARGGLINTTLVAAANNDVLVGLDINPTFTNGAFTGVSNIGARIQNSALLIGASLISTSVANFPLQINLAAATGVVGAIRNSTSTGYSSYRYYNDANRTLDIGYSGSAFSGPVIGGGISGESGWLSTAGAYPLQLGTNNSARFTIFSSGTIGINTATDAGFRLDVNGTARVQSTMQVATTLTVQRNQSVGDVTLSLDNSGGVSNWRGSIAYRTESGGGNQRMVFNSQGSDVISIFGSGGRTVMGQSHTLSDFVSSAVLNLVSTTYGFLPPRMTTTQKNAIVTPAPGLMVYDTTLNKLAVYTGAAWETVTSL